MKLPLEVRLTPKELNVPDQDPEPIDRDIGREAVEDALETFLPDFLAAPLSDAITNPPLPAMPFYIPDAVAKKMREALKPSLSMKFYTAGSCEKPDTIKIEKVWSHLEGADKGNIVVANIGLEFEIYTQPTSGSGYIRKKCPDGQNGVIITREFHTILMISIAINPGGRMRLGLLDFIQPITINCCGE